MTQIRTRRQIFVFHLPMTAWAFFCGGCDNRWTGASSVGHPTPGEAADAGRRHWWEVHRG